MFLNFSLSEHLVQPVVLSESFEQVLAQVRNLESLAHSSNSVQLQVATDISCLERIQGWIIVETHFLMEGSRRKEPRRGSDSMVDEMLFRS